MTFLDEGHHPISKLDRMWLAHLRPPYLPQRQGITDQTTEES
jgi:hypothetical protein